MSFAVLIVSMCRSSGPVLAWHAAANAFWSSTNWLTSAGVSGVASSEKKWSSALFGRQLTGLDPPMPRGSQETRSNADCSAGPNSGTTRSFRSFTPETPGPPGLVNREPIFLPVARCRITASWNVAPDGAAQSTGTVTFVQSSPSPQPDQAGFWP